MCTKACLVGGSSRKVFFPDNPKYHASAHLFLTRERPNGEVTVRPVPADLRRWRWRLSGAKRAKRAKHATREAGEWQRLRVCVSSLIESVEF